MFRFFPKLALMVGLFFATPGLAERLQLRALVIDQMVGMGSRGVIAANESVAVPMTFEMIDLGDNLVALRDIATGRYLRTGVGRYEYLRADSNVVGRAEIFAAYRRGSDLRLRSVRNGQYVGYNVRSGRLRTVFSDADAHSMFTVIRQTEPQPRPRDDEPAPRVDLPFAGMWRLSSVAGPNGGTIRLSRAALHGATLHITRGGGFSGSDGCNQVRGVIRPHGAAMRFDDVLTTRRRCHGDEGRVAQAMQEAFANSALFDVSENGQAMRILDAQEREIVRFSRR